MLRRKFLQAASLLPFVPTKFTTEKSSTLTGIKTLTPLELMSKFTEGYLPYVVSHEVHHTMSGKKESLEHSWVNQGQTEYIDCRMYNTTVEDCPYVYLIWAGPRTSPLSKNNNGTIYFTLSDKTEIVQDGNTITCIRRKENTIIEKAVFKLNKLDTKTGEILS